MDDQGLIKRRGLWLLALMWLPAGVVATAAVRFAPEPAMWAGSLVTVAPCGQGGGDGSGYPVDDEPDLLGPSLGAVGRGMWAMVPPGRCRPTIRTAIDRRHVQVHVPGRHLAGSGSPYASPPPPSNAHGYPVIMVS